MRLKGHEQSTFEEIEGDGLVAQFHMQEAPDKGVAIVLAAPVTEDPFDDAGRSQWFWLRFPDGTLMMACYPQGRTYFATEPYRDL